MSPFINFRPGGWHFEQTGPPRIQNEEADALTKLYFRHFKIENRIDVSLKSLRLGVLEGLGDSGEAYFADVEAAMIAYKKPRFEEPMSSALRRRKGEGLR